jgi:hypothetical protein
MFSSVLRRHLERLFAARPLAEAQQELQLGHMRKLGRIAALPEAPMQRIETPLRVGDRQLERRLLDLAKRRLPRLPLDQLEHLPCLLLDILALLGPNLVNPARDPIKARHATPIRRRVVSARVERHELRRQEHRHRPSTIAAIEPHGGRHIDLVEIRPLFPIDLDRHEVLVQELGDLLVLEALALHHVAPMTGRVADRQEDRFVLLLGFLQRFFAPGIPVHGIVHVRE